MTGTASGILSLATPIRSDTDPRDYVYAVLALYTPDSSSFDIPIQVDYSISLPLLVLEVIKRQRLVGNQFGTQLLVWLKAIGLGSGDGLSGLKTFRESFLHDGCKFTELDDRLLAACWDDFPMTQELPHIIQHLPMGCKIATFDADPQGHLTVRPWQRFKDLCLPALQVPRGDKSFAPCVDPVTEVSFDISIRGSAYTLTARVTSTARPRDLLLRTGQQIYGDPDNRSNSELSDASKVGVTTGVTLDHNHLKNRSPEEFVVVRWMGPGLWKVVGQAHVTACLPHHTDQPAAPSELCFNDDVRKFGLAYSLMSAEATLLQWTHCLAVPYADSETRNRMLDALVSLPPPSSYFYFVPSGPDGDEYLEDCRAKLEPDSKRRYCRPLLTTPYPRPDHLWFSSYAHDFRVGQLHSMRQAEIVRQWEDSGGPSMP